MLGNKIKISDFNPRDKMNILDVFVNNEKVLMSIFEIVFQSRLPHQPIKAMIKSLSSSR